MTRRVKKGWMIYWGLWLFVGFLVPEIIAIVNREPGDTFSEQIWFLQDLGSFFWFLVMGILAWLLYHFGVEGRRNR